MAAAVARFDWSGTPLGPIDGWPASLRIAVDMMLNSHFPKCIVWGPHLVSIYNDAFRPILGRKDGMLGRSFAEIWAEAWDEIGPFCDKAFAGEATFIEDFPLRIQRHGFDETAYFTFCYSPIFDETGRIAGMIDTVVETTSSVLARQQLAVANAELAHRIKNMITMIMSIASSTLRNSPDLETAQHTLSERLRAMAGSQNVLVQGPEGRASIRDIVESTMLPYLDERDRIAISGPDIHLGRRQTLALTLAVHELFTNATKYGALSCESGTITISWDLEATTFTFRWREAGGPPVVAPARRGFGSRLIETVVSREFGGEATLAFDEHGVGYEVSSPAEKLLNH